MIRLVLCAMLLTGCTTNNSVLLRLKTDPSHPHGYSTVIEDRSPTKNTNLLLANGFDVLADPTLRNKVKDNLENFKLPLATYVTTLTPVEDHLRVIMRGIIPEYSSPAKDELEEITRDIVRRKENRYILIGDLLTSGELLSFYLHRPQKNMMSLLFHLPKKEISINDSWSIPVNLTTIGTQFFPSKLERVNKVVVDEIVQLKNGQSVAKLFYVIAERVAGEYDFGPKEEKIALDITISFLAYAEFNIDKGQWIKMTAITFQDDQETPSRSTLQVLALQPITN